MIRPATYNLTIYQRATFRQRFKIPLDFTDREICSQVWKTARVGQEKRVSAASEYERVELLLDFSIEWINKALVEDDVTKGVFELYASPAETSTLPIGERMEWDLLVVDGTELHDGDQNYWIHGAAYVDPGLTECVGGAT
jgi:hypothetical protein